MSTFIKTVWLILVVFAAAAAIVWAQASGSSATGPEVKPSAVQTRAMAPPPPNATKAKSIGKGAAMVTTANNATDSDSFWAEQLDIDGDGQVDDTNLLWDDEDKVLYAYTDGTFACRNGATGTGGLLVAAYGEGNTQHRPAGSGFWVASLDRGECNAQAAALWGCKYDARGATTACGIATVDAKNDDILIATESQ